MIFEGTEKKFELLIKPGTYSFRDLPRIFWDRVVAAAKAEILSQIENDHCQAYLLSESSLFVYDDRVVMITCGKTQLVKSVELIMSELPSLEIESFIFERKNENFPSLQPTSFSDDVERLQSLFAGRAVYFGALDGHHLSVFHLDQPFAVSAEDITTEILMYDLAPAVRELFATNDADAIRKLAHSLLSPEAIIDEFFFEPMGYSMNALWGDTYYTIHVTPNDEGSYASFETNYTFDPTSFETILSKVSRAFLPSRLDVVSFQVSARERLQLDHFVLSGKEQRDLSCGYQVEFAHFQREAQSTEI